MHKPAVLAFALLAFAAAARAQDVPLRTEWQDVFRPRIMGFRPGSNTVLLAIEASGNPVVIDMADPDRPLLLLRLPAATAATFAGPDRVATGHRDGAIRLWSLGGRAAGTPLPPGGGPIASLTPSPSGRTIASLDDKHALTLWPADFSRRIGPLADKRTCGDGEAEPRRSVVAFSPDEKLIAAITPCSDVGVWTADGRAVPVPKRPEPLGTTYALAFARDGSTLAVQSKGQPGDFAHYWPVTNGRLGPALKFPPDLFNAYISSLIAGVGADSLIAATGEHIRFLSARGVPRAVIAFASANSLAVASDAKRLAASSDYRIALWDAARRPASTMPFHDLGDPAAVAISPDGRLLAAVNTDWLRLWRVDGSPIGPPIALAPMPGNAYAQPQLVFADDGKTLWLVDSKGYVRGFSSAGRPLGPAWRPPGYDDEIGQGPVLAGGRILALDRERKHLVAYDLQGRRRDPPILPVARPQLVFGATVDGRHVAIAYSYLADRTIVQVHAGDTGARIATLNARLADGITGLKFSPDGALLAAARPRDRTTVLRWTERDAAPIHIGGVVRFANNGEILVEADGQIRRLRPDGSTLRTAWIGVDSRVLAITGDGMRALIDDGRGAIWRVLDGAAEAPQGFFRTAELRTAQFGPNGAIFAHFSDGRFATVAADGTARWNRIAFREYYTSPTGRISPDGRHMAFPAGDDTVVIATEDGAAAMTVRGRLIGFGPDGDTVLTVQVPTISQSERGARTLFLRHRRDGTPLGESALPPGSGHEFAVADNDGAIAVTVTNAIVLLDASGAASPANFAPAPDLLTRVIFAPGGAWLAAVDVKGRLHRWRRDGAVIGTPPAASDIREVRIALDGRHVLAHTDNDKLLLWRLDGEALAPAGEAATPSIERYGFGFGDGAVWHLDREEALVIRDRALRPVLRLLLRSDGYVAQLPDGRYCGAGPIFETRTVYRGAAPATPAERDGLVDCAAVRAAWPGPR